MEECGKEKQKDSLFSLDFFKVIHCFFFFFFLLMKCTLCWKIDVTVLISRLFNSVFARKYENYFCFEPYQEGISGKKIDA